VVRRGEGIAEGEDPRGELTPPTLIHPSVPRPATKRSGVMRRAAYGNRPENRTDVSPAPSNSSRPAIAKLAVTCLRCFLVPSCEPSDW
jgi:hypothetical protein